MLSGDGSHGGNGSHASHGSHGGHSTTYGRVARFSSLQSRPLIFFPHCDLRGFHRRICGKDLRSAAHQHFSLPPWVRYIDASTHKLFFSLSIKPNYTSPAAQISPHAHNNRSNFSTPSPRVSSITPGKALNRFLDDRTVKFPPGAGAN